MVDVNKLRDTILNIVRTEGPVLPVAISRKLGSDTYFAGAVLSQLVANKSLMITSAKVGGSPLYYIKGQENRLDKLYNYLPGKEKEAYEKLRINQVLKDSECEPAIRVALRSIKDFSRAMQINGELYWRWHLTAEEETKTMVEGPKVAEIKERVPLGTIEPQKHSEIHKKVEIQRPLEITKKAEVKLDDFLNLVVNSLKLKKINVTESNILRKNREVEGKLKINSDLGVLDYYFIAKNKKTLNEADLSLANDKGRKNKLPVLFLSNGKLSKKAEKYAEENLKGRVVFRKI